MLIGAKEELAANWRFENWRKVNKNVEFTDDTAIIAKTEEEFQNTVNKLVDNGRKYDIKINIDKSEVMIVSGRDQ